MSTDVVPRWLLAIGISVSCLEIASTKRARVISYPIDLIEMQSITLPQFVVVELFILVQR
jgi:hypothetical protein